jgi:hypothetical protein
MGDASRPYILLLSDFEMLAHSACKEIAALMKCAQDDECSSVCGHIDNLFHPNGLAIQILKALPLIEHRIVSVTNGPIKAIDGWWFGDLTTENAHSHILHLLAGVRLWVEIACRLRGRREGQFHLKAGKEGIPVGLLRVKAEFARRIARNWKYARGVLNSIAPLVIAECEQLVPLLVAESLASRQMIDGCGIINVDLKMPRLKSGRTANIRIADISDDSPKSARKRRIVDRATEVRNKWIYEQCRKLVPYDAIALKLKKKPKSWLRIVSKQGIRHAAQRYAARHSLPPIPARQDSAE